MSWFFGSKKKEEPPKLPEPQVTGVVDDFNVVQHAYNSPVYPTLPRESLPYSVQARPSPSEDALAKSSVRVMSHNPLESIPFKLSPSLQNGHSSASNINTNIKLLQNSLSRINECLHSELYSYDFKLEKSIIQEANSCNRAQ